MKLLFFCSIWGMADLPLRDALLKIKSAGYDGVEYGCELNAVQKGLVQELCNETGLLLIMQQYAATGSNFNEYAKDYRAHLEYIAEFSPLFINSHTGKDYFTTEQNIQLMKTAQEIQDDRGVKIVHETHRGKSIYSAARTLDFIRQCPSIRLAGDFSHFCAVSESLLEDQEDTLKQIIPHVDHIHARVGHSQGAQVTDPRLPEWQTALQRHLGWWDAIIDHHRRSGTAQLTITPEFGPAPYMPAAPFTQQPLASQWDINLYIKQLLWQRNT